MAARKPQGQLAHGGAWDPRTGVIFGSRRPSRLRGALQGTGQSGLTHLTPPGVLGLLHPETTRPQALGPQFRSEGRSPPGWVGWPQVSLMSLTSRRGARL